MNCFTNVNCCHVGMSYDERTRETYDYVVTGVFTFDVYRNYRNKGIQTEEIKRRIMTCKILLADRNKWCLIILFLNKNTYKYIMVFFQFYKYWTIRNFIIIKVTVCPRSYTIKLKFSISHMHVVNINRKIWYMCQWENSPPKSQCVKLTIMG